MRFKEDKRTENLLRLKGVLAQGFGTIGRIVMRDKRLSVEAKGIYSYISSFAGSGTTAFPSVDTITKELNISEMRFYRHRQLLIDLNYIEITRERTANRFGRNVYELVQNPVPLDKQPSAENSVADATAELEGEHKQKFVEELTAETDELSEGEELTEAAELKNTAEQTAVDIEELFGRLPKLKKALNFAHKNINARDTAAEVLSVLGGALVAARGENGFKFNKKTYDTAQLEKVFAVLGQKDVSSIIAAIHPEWGREDIQNKSLYILGCVFNIYKEREWVQKRSVEPSSTMIRSASDIVPPDLPFKDNSDWLDDVEDN